MNENKNSSLSRTLSWLSHNSQQESETVKKIHNYTLQRRAFSEIGSSIVNNNKRKPCLITDYLKSSKICKGKSSDLKCQTCAPLEPVISTFTTPEKKEKSETFPGSNFSDTQCDITSSNVVSEKQTTLPVITAVEENANEDKSESCRDNNPSETQSVAINKNVELKEKRTLAEWEIKLQNGMDCIAQDKSLLYNQNEATVTQTSSIIEKEAIIKHIEEKLGEITESKEITIRSRTWDNCVFFENR